MVITTFASGSGGNCTLVSLGGEHFLIDAGISFRRIRENLSLSGLKPEDLSAVLITHEHSDHISGLATMSRRSAAPVLAPPTVMRRVCAAVPDAIARLRELPAGVPYRSDGVTLRCFHTPHDTEESVGWRLEAEDGTFALATDMGRVTDEIWEGLCGAGAVVIEANHDVDMLRDGPYPYALKRRILSDRGHLSNDDCASLALRLAGAGTEYIILGHISKENNRPELALRTVADALADTAARVYIAPPAERLTLEIEAGRGAALC